ncbi:MAG: hypothetical protein LUI12_02030 [Clostridiales bacterium]|nr:hypothetical protein [Clostridiales bacterium]
MNPIQIIQMLKSGGNPQQMIQQMMNNSQIMQNPMAKNAINMYQKGDMDGLRTMANNLAKERGTTVDDVKSSIMQQFGMK